MLQISPERADPRRFAAAEQGNVLVELALMLPVLVLLMMGTIDFGMAMYDQMQLRSAARAGAEYAVIDPENLGAVEDAVEAALGGPDPAMAVATGSFCECPGASGSVDCGLACEDETTPRKFVAVEVTRPVDTLLPYPNVIQQITLRGEATFRVR
ncbi:MAG: TadE/TadG family type IV pilus assembly protein [Kiloniellales bacterium]